MKTIMVFGYKVMTMDSLMYMSLENGLVSFDLIRYMFSTELVLNSTAALLCIGALWTYCMSVCNNAYSNCLGNGSSNLHSPPVHQ